VEWEGQIITCKARGKLRLGQTAPMAGDRVQIALGPTPGEMGTVTRIFPRENMLYRPPIANIDLTLLVLAAAQPEPDLLLIDKLLILTARMEIGAAICINKYDLAPERAEEIREIYSSLDVEVIPCSALTGYNLEGIARSVRGKTAVLAGQSGVGKSRLARYLTGDYELEVGELSEKLGRGKHTTRQVRLLPTSGQGRLADTPGFSSFTPEGLESRSLYRLYPDFLRAVCRFSDCRHLEEPDCGVRESVESGIIKISRYENYRRIHQELREKEAARY
jgi:ribosome biogenesis GTPase